MISAIAGSSWAAGFRHVNCARSDCNRWLTQRHLSVRPVGLRLGDAWYCGYRCAVERIEARFVELLVSVSKPAPRRLRMPLGLLLVSRGAITGEQLRIAKEHQQSTQREMGDVLLGLGFSDEEQITAARSSLWSCPVFTRPARVLPPSISIPSALMHMHSAVPIQNGGADKLLIGFLDRVDYGLLYAVEQVTGSKTTPCFVTPTDHRAYMESLMPPGNELSYHQTMTPQEMTQTVCQQGARADANALAIVRCGDSIWARLTGGTKPVDLLFRVH